MKIIAEIASSHNGSLDFAKALIKSAAENGADIVKFQDWRSKNVADSDRDKMRYNAYEFKDEWYPELIDFCKQNNVEFLTSCFNAHRIEFLASLGLKKIKIASVCLTNHDLLIHAGAAFDEIILSTAMCTRDEIEDAIDTLASCAKRFTVMHCVANYPTKPEDANLARIDELKKIIGDQEYASVGFSSHSLDLDVDKIAMSKGITYLEKHFTLSRDTSQIPHIMYEGGEPTTTHEIAIEPSELKELSDYRDRLRIIEGSPEFTPNEVEMKIREKYSKRYGS